jgi:nitrogenase molybdenum-iron protein alpha/beta subunit
MGLAATDDFFAVLKGICGGGAKARATAGSVSSVGLGARPTSHTATSSSFRRFEKERARYLDALIDCHKYAAQCRVAISGEPDFVASATHMCAEVGIFPVVVATGSRCPGLREMLTPTIEAVATSHIAEFFTAHDATTLGSDERPAAASGSAASTSETCPAAKRFAISDDADFNDIEAASRLHGANVMLGSSDARRVAHKLRIPLVRAAFPVHDHVGGQRIRTLGYEGSLSLIDQMVNHLIEHTETSFRDDLRERYY